MSKQSDILEDLYAKAAADLSTPLVPDAISELIKPIARCNSNKAPIRFLMSCLLAKIDNPAVDIRKPYTEIGGEGTYSGRTYDQNYVESFVRKYKLPVNSTTAYLTPAFRTNNQILTPEITLVGRPKEVYGYTLEVLDAVYQGTVSPATVHTELIRHLLIIKSEDDLRMEQLLANLKPSEDHLPLSSEETLMLLKQHLESKNASRLPVLVVAAAYRAVGEFFGENALSMHAHNAADSQTGSTGDIEIVLQNDSNVVTSYEMKDKRVTKNDIDHAVEKIATHEPRIQNYIFITTEEIEHEVAEFAKSFYEQIGVEIAILDCLGFARHFLHMFHRHRATFLEHYQELVLREPNSSVSQTLKESFLALRRQAESDRNL